jgi:hypothetical protein
MAKLTRVKKTKRAGHSGGAEGPSGRFWTMWIKPKGAALLSQTLKPCHFVIKNHGSNNIRLVAQLAPIIRESWRLAM